MRTTLFALASVAFLAAMPTLAAPAEPSLSNPTSLIDNANPDQVAELLRELGAGNVEIRGTGNERVVGFQDGDVPHNVGFSVCNVRPGKCLAMTTLVVVNTGDQQAPALDALNAVNGSMFVTVVRLDANRFAVGRVHFIDGGVTKKNLAMNIAVYATTFQEVMKALSNQVVAGIQPRSVYLSAPARRTMPRPVQATPQEIAHIAKMMSAQYATKLPHARR